MAPLRWVLLLLIFLIPNLADATTYYVRPGFDSLHDTALTYGTGDGLSDANALAGFTTINNGTFPLAPGDIVCLPGSDEPFYGETIDFRNSVAHGTAGNPITVKGCDAVIDGLTSTNKALLWSVSDLTGDRSYNASNVAVNGAEYAWDTVATNIYRKKIHVKARVLWEDATWLLPLGCYTCPNYYAASEATILAALTPGTWVNKDNGDGTYRLYYRATDASHSPTLSTIRISAPPLSGTSLAQTSRNYITMQDIEFRGHSTASVSTCLGSSGSHVILERLLLTRCHYSLMLTSGATAVSDILLKDVEILNALGVGLLVRGGVGGSMADLTVDGGQYSYTNGFYYTGSAWTGTDGDGIGLGFEGGTWSDFVIKNASLVGNYNSAIYYGTSTVLALTNLTLQSLYMDANRKGCFSEGSTNHGVRGILLIKGVVCARSLNLEVSAYPLYGGAKEYTVGSITNDIGIEDTNALSRQIILENVTFVGSKNQQRIRMRNEANNVYHMKNVLFTDNPGAAQDDGDLFVIGATIAPASTFDHIYFSSARNQHRHVGRSDVPSTHFYYDVPDDLTAFTTRLGATDVVYNADTLVDATYRPQETSPLRDAGAQSANCWYADGVDCSADANPDIGAWYFDGGTPDPPPPAAPTGLHIVGAFSNTLASIVWLPNSDEILGYKIYRGTAPNAPTLIATVTPATAATTHQPLTLYHAQLQTAGTYYLSVAAYNAAGVGIRTAEVSVTVDGVAARAAASRAPRVAP